MNWHPTLIALIMTSILSACVSDSDNRPQKSNSVPTPAPTPTDNLVPIVPQPLPNTAAQTISLLPQIAKSFPTLAAVHKLDFEQKTILDERQFPLKKREGISTVQTRETTPKLISTKTPFIHSQQFNQLKQWDRLERDRLINTQQFKNDKDFSSLLREDTAKILVMDSRLNPLANNNYDEARVKYEVYVYDKQSVPESLKNHQEATEHISHGNAVLNRIIGKGSKIQPNTLRTGILYQVGSIYFIGGSRDYEDVISLPLFLSNAYISPAFSKGYKIVNLSLGAFSQHYEQEPTSDIELFYQQKKIFSDRSMKILQRYVTQHDALFVIASGNKPKNDKNPKRNLLITLPAFSQSQYGQDFSYGILAVSGYDPDRQQHDAETIPCGPSKTFCLVADSFSYVPLAPSQPGRLRYLARHGSSFAAPYVASVAALTKSVFPFMRNRELQQTILTTATDLGDEGIDEVFGWGAVNPLKAIHGPAQFYGKNFEVDLSHDASLQTDQAIYRFSNDISGKYGLVVTGNYKQNVLSLSGFNSYEGDTVLNPLTIVNIDGVQLNSDTIVKPNAQLYGSGRLRGLANDGKVHSYSYFKHSDPHSTRSQHGMQVEQYYQSKQGTLAIYLGLPLFVQGLAQIDGGTLDIVGVQSAFINSKQEVSNDAVIAQSIGGNFDQVTISTPLLTGKATLRKQRYLMQNKQTFDTISVTAKYLGLSNVRLTASPQTTELLAGAKVLDRLIDRLSDDETPKNRQEGLYQFAAQIQSMTSLARIQSTTLSFSGKSHQESLLYNQLINSLSDSYFLRNLNTGIHYLSNPSLAFIQFQKEQIKLQITQGDNEIDTALGKHRTKSFGTQIGWRLPTQTIPLQMDLAYQHHHNQDSYTKTLGSQSYHFYQRYAQSQWSLGLATQKTWRIEENEFTPILGVKLAYIHQDPYQENYDQSIYEVSRYRFWLPQAIAGLSYQYTLAKHFQLKADYTMVQPIGSFALPVKFMSASQSYRFDMPYQLKATHHFNFQIHKQFKHMNAQAGVYATFSDRWRSGFSIGVGAQF